MVKVDLITGFLGAGKTTFIKRYADYLLTQGQRVCVLENDYGAINVDRVLLKELSDKGCDVEMIVGGDGCDAHQRRLKTKLITLAMCGYGRVIVEPSGIFDVEEFFDLLYEEPLAQTYEIGSVITIVDAKAGEASGEGAYLLATQVACAGRVVFSKCAPGTDAAPLVEKLQTLLQAYGCGRELTPETVMTQPWEEWDEATMGRMVDCGYVRSYATRRPVAGEGGYEVVFSFDVQWKREELVALVEGILGDSACGRVFRIKGFMDTTDVGWLQVNAMPGDISIAPCDAAQNVLIVIGEALQRERIGHYLPLKGQ